MNFNIFEWDRLLYALVMVLTFIIHGLIFDYRKINKYKKCDHKCYKGKICDEWLCKYYDKVTGLY